MDEEHRASLRARGEEFVRAFLALAQGSRGFVESLHELLAPDARVHLQNGDVVPPEVAVRVAQTHARVFADLEMELRDILFAEDWMVARVQMLGTASLARPFVPAGYQVDAAGAFIARIRPDLRVSEVRVHANPAFAIAFPPRGVRLPPPPRDGATDEAARALYDTWLRGAEAGDDFVRSVASSLASDGVVHLGNGDVGHADALAELFDRIASGLHDLSIEIEDVIFSDGHVVAPFRMSGVHRGRIGFLPPTGRVLPSSGAVIARANARGEAAEVWLYMAPAFAITVPPGQSSR